MNSWKIQSLLSKYSDRIPVTLERYNSKEQMKYLVPKDMTAAMFISLLRKRNLLKEDESIFLFIKKDRKLISFSENMINLYEENKTDGVLELVYTYENVFGL